MLRNGDRVTEFCILMKQLLTDRSLQQQETKYKVQYCLLLTHFIRYICTLLFLLLLCTFGALYYLFVFIDFILSFVYVYVQKKSLQ